MRWSRKAAEAGHGGAAVNLGQCYQNGDGVPRDRNEAIKWYRIAIDMAIPPRLASWSRSKCHRRRRVSAAGKRPRERQGCLSGGELSRMNFPRP